MSNKPSPIVERESGDAPGFYTTTTTDVSTCSTKAEDTRGKDAATKAERGSIKVSAAASASAICRVALVNTPEASRKALAKHRPSIDPELAEMLELVGGYDDDVEFSLLFMLVHPFCMC